MISHAEASELLGAYALNAVDLEEATRIADHLDDCVDCLEDYRRFVEVAALLGPVEMKVDDEVWDAIAREIGGGTPPPPPLRLEPLVQRDQGRRTASERRRLLEIAAGGIAAAAIVVLSIAIGHLTSEIKSLRGSLSAPQLNAAATSALANPGTRVLSLDSPKGTELALIGVTRSGGAYLIPRSLRVLPPDKTYQLWAPTSHGIVSLGVLGANPSTSWLHLDAGV
ncbi:MAG: anti-sigma factor domain-containing protein, partial [Acidimicrobiales bacterium]